MNLLKHNHDSYPLCSYSCESYPASTAPDNLRSNSLSLDGDVLRLQFTIAFKDINRLWLVRTDSEFREARDADDFLSLGTQQPRWLFVLLCLHHQRHGYVFTLMTA